VAIKRFYAKELIGFSEIELEFGDGLTVFTGASGSGKSVLMEGILSVFGYKEPKALNAEAWVERRFERLEEIGIDNEEPNAFRYLKKDKTRYFINANAIAKKELNALSKLFSSYLSSKEENDFTNERLCNTLDSFIQDEKFLELKRAYTKSFEALQATKKELSALKERAKQAAEEREFLEFELKKFSEINPQEGEEEKLTAIKKELSKKDKLSGLLAKAESIKSAKSAVLEIFEFVGKDGGDAEGFFAALDEAVGEADFKLSNLEGVDIDFVFERLDKLSYLNKKYGGIAEAIERFDEKKRELQELESLESRIDSLGLDMASLEKTALELAKRISKFRCDTLKIFEDKLLFFADKLLVKKPKLSLLIKELSPIGIDGVELSLQESHIAELSAGEYRRLRLALLACENSKSDEKSILFLDEADANLSGEESAGVAYLLKELSKEYQVFAISHQPQLASVATRHFVVFKEGENSFARELQDNEKALEIARMVSGTKITNEAIKYAEKLLSEAKN